MDTGSSATDGITTNKIVNVTGLENGATWQYSVNASPFQNGTGTTFNLPADLVYEGGAIPDILVRQTDIAGNESKYGSNSNTWTLDTVAPIKLANININDTGTDVDHITVDGTVTVNDLEIGAKLWYSIDGAVKFTQATDNKFVVPEGTYDMGKIVIKQIDAAGNVSDSTQLPFKLVVDTAPVFQHATAVGKTLILSFTDSSFYNTNIPITAFSVITDGVSDSVTAVAVNSQDQTVTLTLAKPINYTQSITKFTYTPPALSANAIQDSVGNKTTSFSGQILNIASTSKTGWGSFSVIKNDGSVVSWGLFTGGDSLIRNVVHNADGSANFIVVGSVTNQLNGIDDSKDAVQICSTNGGYAALRADGSVVFWGLYDNQEDVSTLLNKLNGSDNSLDVVEIFSNYYAYAALRANGSVITWWGNGHWDNSGGGDISLVATQLDGSDNTKNVVKIYSTWGAFAALRADGSVVAWGNSYAGGDSSSVAMQLNGSDNSKDVVQIYSCYRGGTFAALRADGSVVTWGNGGAGGDSSSVAMQLNGSDNSKDVVQIFSTNSAFAALRADGSVITWGNGSAGGDSSSVAMQLNGSDNSKDVVQIYSNGGAFVALRADGSVVTWGNSDTGGDSSLVAMQLNGSDNSKDVVQIFSTNSAFAALRADGSVITWGNGSAGGDSSSVAIQLNGSDNSKDVVQIYSSGTDFEGGAFAALRSDGSVITWGDSRTGGDSSTVATQLDGSDNGKDVVRIYSDGLAFAALRADGAVVTWGSANYGGDSSTQAQSLSSGVVDFANSHTGTFINGIDNTPPLVNSASVNGNTLILKMSDINHLSTTTAPANAYSVMVNGVVNTVLSANVYPATDIVMLSLTNLVMSGQSISVSYNDPSSSDDLYALQDIVGNDVPSFIIQSVQLVGVPA